MNNKRAIVITVIIAVLLFLCTVIVSYRYTHRFEMIEKEGLGWITKQVRTFIDIVAEAKKDLPIIP